MSPGMSLRRESRDLDLVWLCHFCTLGLRDRQRSHNLEKGYLSPSSWSKKAAVW
jgi:hypothetical protein